jgi:hypothetical protein
MNVTAQIIQRLTENKQGVRTYAEYDRAEKIGDELSAKFNTWNGTDVPVDFIVTHVPTVNRYTVVFNLSAWSARAKTGTYLGWFAQKGFFSI